MTFDDFKKKFLAWSEEKIETKKDDGFPVCPYARFARLNNKVQFLDARDSLDVLHDFDDSTYEIGIAWLGDDANVDLVDSALYTYKEAHPQLLYFTSTPTSGHFAKNFTKCVFIQLRGDILEKRSQLHNTKYYESWPDFYYKMIMEDL
jgi:hypothetical protein